MRTAGIDVGIVALHGDRQRRVFLAFPTRRSSDLAVVAAGDGQRDGRAGLRAGRISDRVRKSDDLAGTGRQVIEVGARVEQHLVVEEGGGALASTRVT